MLTRSSPYCEMVNGVLQVRDTSKTCAINELIDSKYTHIHMMIPSSKPTDFHCHQFDHDLITFLQATIGSLVIVAL